MERLRMVGGGTVTNCPFPVGFGGFFQTDPNSIYSGTKWEQKKDVFILASGTAYPTGSTGGEAEHVLTVDEIALHNHIEMLGDGAGTQNINLIRRIEVGGTEEGGKIVAYYSGGLGQYITTANAGGSKPHNNMPPYFAMPFWIRAA